MEEIWKIDSNGEDFLFGEIEDLLIDDDGTIFVLDSQLANVKAFSPAGQHLRTIGREGDGPGESRAPGDLVFMPDGSLGLVSKLNWQITKIDKETGEPRGDIHVFGNDDALAMLQQVKGLGGAGQNKVFAAVAMKSTGAFWHWEMDLSLYRDETDGRNVYPEKTLCTVGEAEGSDLEEEAFFTIWDPWTIDALGRVVIAPYWGSYTLRYYDNDGEVVQQVELPFLQRARTPQEEKRLLEQRWGGTSPAEIGIDLVLSETEAVVRRIHPRPDGSLWIQTCNSAHKVGAGVFRVYDIVDAEGTLTGRAEIHGQADDLVDKVYWGPDDLMVVVHGAERYVQNHRGLKKDAPEYDLVVAGYRLRGFADD
ncbi:MAG: 6-bladed beta-propeller [Candidatus Krumholzibacteria bacterium]|nr:6-bladed beta-propeller [Candidatus Krumholzibacteria bacterium]